MQRVSSCLTDARQGAWLNKEELVQLVEALFLVKERQWETDRAQIFRTSGRGEPSAK